MVNEVSYGFVVRNKNLLMVFDDSSGVWNVPSTPGERGELSADAAERAVTSLTGCDSRVARYRGCLKTEFEYGGEDVKLQPYSIEIEGDPQDGEWVPISELSSKELAEPLTGIREEMVNRL